jgi:hypothetical protein
MTQRPPVLAPVAPSEPSPRRASRWGTAFAAGLAAVVLVFSILLLRGRIVPAHDLGPSRFGPGTERRIDALRDRLASGLLALREPDGHWVPRRLDPSVEPVHEAEATAFGLAGLAAARRLGSRVAGIPDAIDGARAWLRKNQHPDGGFGGTVRGGRAMGILAVSTAILGWTLADDAADEDVALAAAGRLEHEVSLGELPDGWTRGVATMAILALASIGRGGAFGDDPLAAVRVRATGTLRDTRDPRVAEAFARIVHARGGATDAFPGEILEKAIEAKPEWGDDRTDLYSWVLRAWLASRVAGGDRWFAATLPELEKAPGPDGAIPGDFYGFPASRTACALLILLEGRQLRPPYSFP